MWQTISATGKGMGMFSGWSWWALPLPTSWIIISGRCSFTRITRQKESVNGCTAEMLDWYFFIKRNDTSMARHRTEKPGRNILPDGDGRETGIHGKGEIKFEMDRQTWLTFHGTMANRPNKLTLLANTTTKHGIAHTGEMEQTSLIISGPAVPKPKSRYWKQQPGWQNR